MTLFFAEGEKKFGIFLKTTIVNFEKRKGEFNQEKLWHPLKLSHKSFLKLKLYQIDSINLFYFFNSIFWFGIHSYNRKNSHLWKKQNFRVFESYTLYFLLENLTCIYIWSNWGLNLFTKKQKLNQEEKNYLGKVFSKNILISLWSILCFWVKIKIKTLEVLV